MSESENPHIGPTPVQPPIRLGTWSDREIQERGDDRFSFRDYARVLAGPAATADTPLTIGIYGKWGSGKSSLMHLIDRTLDKTDARRPIYSIWINVWQLGTQDEVWQAFLQALFSEVHNQLSFRQRVDWLKLAAQIAANLLRLVIVLTPMLLTLWLGQNAENLDTLTAAALARGGLVATVGLFVWNVARIRPIVEAARETVSFDLQAVLKDAPYEEQVSHLMQLQDRFAQMVALLAGENGRLVVFIDDLDRCTPDKVPEVLEAIKLFTTTAGCVYIIGLDYDIVRQGIETRYKFETAAAATEYLEKIVQVPFHLPPLEEGRIEEFVRDDYPDLHREASTTAEVFAAGLEPNPRKVKRALNIYRTLLDLARVRIRAWEMDPVDPELVAKMVVIESRFRSLHDYLIRHPDFLLKVEKKALNDGLDEEVLGVDDVLGPVLLGTRAQDDSEAKPGLVEPAGLGALANTLRAGERHFNDADQRGQIGSYIYLIATTEGVAGQTRPNRRQRDALLGGDREAIKDQVGELLARGEKDPAERQRIGDMYIERLEGVLAEPGRRTDPEQESAQTALALLELSLCGQTLESIQARLDSFEDEALDARRLIQPITEYCDEEEVKELSFFLKIDYDDLPAPDRAGKVRELVTLVNQTDREEELLALLEEERPDVDWQAYLRPEDEEELRLEELQGSWRERLKKRLTFALDGSGFYDSDQLQTTNTALDLLEGWQRQDFEPQTLRVPAGSFLMGSTVEQAREATKAGGKKKWVERELPQHTVELGGYAIGRYPVTNAQYQVFVRETGREPPMGWQAKDFPEGGDDHPVVNVSWHDAVAYCRWLSGTTGRDYRLPSEAEWERAARGGDGRIYPWGDAFDPALANVREGGVSGTSPAAAYPAGASPYGVLDMSGNVLEWTRSVLADFPYDPDDGREPLPDPEAPRVVRGGSWRSRQYEARAACRRYDLPGLRADDAGFRVARRSASSYH